MRLPDRPALNVVLGVVLGLAVLVFLSSPGIVGQKQASTLLFPASVPNSNSGQSLSSSQSSSSAPNNTMTMVSTLSSSATIAAAQSSSGVPAPSNSFGGSGSNASSSSLGSTNRPVPTFSSSSPQNLSMGTVNGSQGSTAGETQTAVITTVVQQGVSTTVAAPGNSSRASTASVSAEPALSSQISSVSLYSTLAILTFGAVIIAVGSMLFVYRRVNSEDSED